MDWYFKLSPNGRLPTIVDPNNNDLVLWESGAILEYLVDTYDKENKLNVTDFADKWHLKQYLHFQMSGQGPYFGQFVWFSVYHQENFPSAKERYEKEIVRVIGVLNDILKGKEYLVGGKVYVLPPSPYLPMWWLLMNLPLVHMPISLSSPGTGS